MNMRLLALKLGGELILHVFISVVDDLPPAPKPVVVKSKWELVDYDSDDERYWK